jgi:hypothetical protein
MLEEKPWILKLLQILALEVAEDKPEIRATLRSILRRARDSFVTGMNEALGTELPGDRIVAGLILAFLDGISLGMQVAPDEISLDDAFEEIRRVTIFMVASRLNPELLQVIEQGAAAWGKGDGAASENTQEKEV